MNITKSRIDSLKPTNGRSSYIWESKTPGFGVKVTAKGQKRFVFKYRVGKGRSAKQRWMFLVMRPSSPSQQLANRLRFRR